MDISKELSKSKAVLLVMPPEIYEKTALGNAKALSKKGNVAYFTLSRTSKALKGMFKSNGIDAKGFFFVDAISCVFMPICPFKTPNTHYASSPGALTEFSVLAGKLAQQGCGHVIFDKLDDVLIYNPSAPVAKFVSNLAGQVRRSKSSALFYFVDKGNHPEAIREAALYVDKVIDLRKKKTR